jgi:hypothetical protein
MISRKENFAIIGTVLTTVLLSVSNIFFVVRQFDSDPLINSQKFVIYDAGPPTPEPGLRILILLSLIISGLVLLVRAKETLVVSILALMGAVAVYVLWLKDSIHFVRNATYEQQMAAIRGTASTPIQ